MNIFKRAAGKILYGIGKLLSAIFDGLIFITETIVNLVINIAKGFLVFLGMGGCLILFIIAGPLGIYILLNPAVLLTIILFVIFPLLGTKFVSYLKYIKYTITEYLFDRGDYLIKGDTSKFKSFKDYRNIYINMEEERKRKEYEDQRRQQQKQWEEVFRQWYENQSRRSNQGSYDYGYERPYYNPVSDFKSKYEKSCDLLGVPYNADKYEIKLAFRKKAKEFHPDLNKSPDATRIFQEINEAYDFLNDDNINRYKSIQGEYR